MDKELVPELRFEGFTGAWEQRKLGELCTISKGHGYSKADIRDVGTPLILYGRLYTQYESRIEDVDTFVVGQEGSLLSKGNEVIVPASGETAEDIAVASSVRRPGIIFGGDLNVVTPVRKLDPDYTALAITYSKAHDDLAKRAQGKSVVHVHGNDIAEVEVSYPSESEQKRISTVVLGLDNLITLHQRKYETLRAVKDSMLDKMFPKGGATEPELRFDGFTGPWERVKLSDVYRKGDEKNSELEFGFDRTISVSNMKWNPAGNGAASSSLPTYKILRKGDIAFEGNRTKGHPYGKMVINDIGDGIMSSRFRTIAARGPVCIRFWKYYLLNDAVFRPIYIRSTKRGTLMTELVTEELLESELLIPSSEEQELIGGALNAADKQIVCEATNLATLKQLKAALLDKMFPKGAR